MQEDIVKLYFVKNIGYQLMITLNTKAYLFVHILLAQARRQDD